MLKKVYNVGALFGVVLLSLSFESTGLCQQPEKVSICQLKSDPAKYNHKVIQVTGFMTHGFEDFALFDPSCQSRFDIWLEYGGTAKSGTMYCCGVTAERTRPKQIEVENITIPLVEDDRFRKFDQLIQRRPDSIVHATIVGRFFSCQLVKYPKVTRWGGYGHMGCCSLLMIEQVLSVDPHDRNDLDYGASADQPNSDKVGCGYSDLGVSDNYADLIEAQHQAELGQRAWAFADPRRVAVDSMARLFKLEQASIKGITKTRQLPGRLVYEWKPPKKKITYMVVVSRPYWLSFDARDAKKVAWVAIAAYESGCGKDFSVTRIQ